MELIDLIDYISPYLEIDDLENLIKLNREFQTTILNKYQTVEFVLSSVFYTKDGNGSGICTGTVFFPRPSQLIINKWYNIVNIINIDYNFEDLVYFSLIVFEKQKNLLTIWKSGLGFMWSTLLNLYDIQILLNGKDLVNCKEWEYKDYKFIKDIKIFIRKKSN
jgi:hypothetical protein